eukprot:6180948-Pleurochrysis_carterae.AAC.1
MEDAHGLELRWCWGGQENTWSGAYMNGDGADDDVLARASQAASFFETTRSLDPVQVETEDEFAQPVFRKRYKRGAGAAHSPGRDRHLRRPLVRVHADCPRRGWQAAAAGDAQKPLLACFALYYLPT